MTAVAPAPRADVLRAPSETTVMASRAPGRGRTASVDLVRGAVMILMALDHVRAYFTSARFDATDLAATSAPLFLTRWITHFCAPAFVLLAGVGAAMAARRRTPRELSTFLVTRGAWLVVLEFTVITFGWYFNFEYSFGVFAQVIWAIGVSMIALGGLVRLPRTPVAVIAGAMIAGHNLLDGIEASSLGALEPLWIVLHVEAPLEVLPVFIIYPLIPWIGVMALGYLLGPVFELPAARRRRTLLRFGAAMTAGFLVLRAANGYGDPSPWSVQDGPVMTALSFLNTTKYPPSMLYLMMTLGPTLLALGLLDRVREGGWIATFGRVPLFYYVVHLYLIHTMAIAVATAQGYGVGALANAPFVRPDGFGFGLVGVYALTALAIGLLYPMSRWYDRRKRRGTGWWWSYM